MNRNRADISRFFVIGINYKKTDTLVRGSFAIGPEQYEKLLTLAASFGMQEMFVLSTCNRTEIYGFADDPELLADLLCSQTSGSKQLFSELSYCKNGVAAISHLFHVGAGLDSQILGDYEIVGQLRIAVKFAKERKFIGPLLDRIVNAVLQSSKTIKNQTGLSDGTVSVSFSAVQFIRETVEDIADKNILLIGVGKIGRITSRNLVDYLGTRNITLINRTEEKAADLATELGIQCAPSQQLDQYIQHAQIVVVATNASEPVVLKAQLEQAGPKLILDLSIPCNVEKQVRRLPGIRLIDVDELSAMKDKTLQKREAEVPKAKAIIAKHMEELMAWHAMRKHVPVLKAVKNKLQEIHTSPLFIQSLPGQFPLDNRDEKIQRVINGMATKIRRENQLGCHYIEAINEFMSAVV